MWAVLRFAWKACPEGVPPERHCDHFLVFCPGKPQMRSLANVLICWQDSGHTRSLEAIQMSSREDPDTWKYFDLPVIRAQVGRHMEDCLRITCIWKGSSKRGLTKKKARRLPYPPEATASVKQAVRQGVRRFRKAGLTTNVNQTGATLTSVAVAISTTGVRSMLTKPPLL